MAVAERRMKTGERCDHPPGTVPEALRAPGAEGLAER
jgi:hypothetical protein